MSRIGSEIIKLRKEKGMTQKQLGKLVGVSEGFIDEVEAGKRVLNGDLLVRITKVLGQAEDKYDLYDIKDGATVQVPIKVVPKPVQQVWNDALEGVLKTVPVFDYKMDKAIDTKQLPIISNKVEGYPKDKVVYLKIEDNEMLGFRISKDDLVLACLTQEIEKDAIFFLEHNGKRAVKQIKRLEGDKLLLVSNKGSLVTETVTLKSIKVIARLIRLEIKL